MFVKFIFFVYEYASSLNYCIIYFLVLVVVYLFISLVLIDIAYVTAEVFVNKEVIIVS